MNNKSHFDQYMESLNASSYKIFQGFGLKDYIDFYNNGNTCVGTLYIAKSVTFKLTPELLSKTDYKIGEMSLAIMKNGFGDKDWLYAGEIVDIL